MKIEGRHWFRVVHNGGRIEVVDHETIAWWRRCEQAAIVRVMVVVLVGAVRHRSGIDYLD